MLCPELWTQGHSRLWPPCSWHPASCKCCHQWAMILVHLERVGFPFRPLGVLLTSLCLLLALTTSWTVTQLCRCAWEGEGEGRREIAVLLALSAGANKQFGHTGQWYECEDGDNVWQWGGEVVALFFLLTLLWEFPPNHLSGGISQCSGSWFFFAWVCFATTLLWYSVCECSFETPGA